MTNKKFGKRIFKHKKVYQKPELTMGNLASWEHNYGNHFG